LDSDHDDTVVDAVDDAVVDDAVVVESSYFDSDASETGWHVWD
jgi:hypothetical protein